MCCRGPRADRRAKKARSEEPSPLLLDDGELDISAIFEPAVSAPQLEPQLLEPEEQAAAVEAQLRRVAAAEQADWVEQHSQASLGQAGTQSLDVCLSYDIQSGVWDRDFRTSRTSALQPLQRDADTPEIDIDTMLAMPVPGTA